MKKLTLGFVMLVAILSMSSCSKIVYTHEQVMQNYHTKQEVIKQFGWPDEKREVQGTTEWAYNGDSISKHGTPGTWSVADSLNTKTLTVDTFTDYPKYIKFTFNAQGAVIKWDSHGVSLAKRKSNPVGTVLVVIGSVAAALSLIGLLLINLDNLQFL